MKIAPGHAVRFQAIVCPWKNIGPAEYIHGAADDERQACDEASKWPSTKELVLVYLVAGRILARTFNAHVHDATR